MNKFLVSFDAARATPAIGLPDKALNDAGEPKPVGALISACSEHFKSTARHFIPGIAIKPGQGYGNLEVMFRGGRDEVNTLKSIPGPFTFERMPG